MRRLVAQGLLGAVDLHGAEWIDVDTPADHEVAERLLSRRQLASEPQ
jgi:NDP-sugar pyrophosphorylase family protein